MLRFKRIPATVLSALVLAIPALANQAAAAGPPSPGCGYSPEEMATWSTKKSRRPVAPSEEIQGIPCTGVAWLYENGNLAGCVFARDDTLSGQALPAGTSVTLTPEGWMISCGLPRDTPIQGHLCRGVDYDTSFHRSGKLRGIYLAQEERIQGVPCARASFWTEFLGRSAKVCFYADGQLARCRLAQDTAIEGRTYHRGHVVRFDRQGKIE